MGLFEDFSRFFETRLEEFLRNNPHLELQALDEQLREQEEETIRLLASFRARETKLKEEILATAQDVKRWHLRIKKAENANRFDLVNPAKEREAQLLRQGNQLWGKMQGVQTRIQKTSELQQQIQTRRNEIKIKIAQVEATRKAEQSSKSTSPSGWENFDSKNDSSKSSFSHGTTDHLEETFRRWETEEELQKMKRDLGK